MVELLVGLNRLHNALIKKYYDGLVHNTQEIGGELC